MPSYVTEDHWRERVGQFPMPEGATAEMLWAAEDALRDMSELDEAVKGMGEIQEIRDKWAVRLENARIQVEVINRDADWGDREKYDRLKTLVDSLDEIIEIYKERLNG